MKLKELHIGILTVAVLLLLACGTADLGSSDPDFQEVSITDPTWEQDILPIIQLKCQNCHGQDRHPFAPGNTPPYEDSKFDTLSVFKAKMVSLKERMKPDAEKPMPPDFATPLTSDERKAIEVFMTKSQPKSTPAPTAVPGSAQPVVKFSEVSALFTTTCAVATCHVSGAQNPPLTNLTELKGQRARIVARVGSADAPMPTAGAAKQPTAAERELMIRWATDGTDD